jgi:hypothetical protein
MDPVFRKPTGCVPWRSSSAPHPIRIKSQHAAELVEIQERIELAIAAQIAALSPKPYLKKRSVGRDSSSV